ncbi:MAG TPA: ATP-binding cassette domain-containing protein [Flavitalea sp.]|nr:ATP-binding cassette domain-containing protein [Flavitalea sp.]
MAILRVNAISKNYGAIQALKSVSFEVPPGSVFGILGPNGSGKTTLLGIVTDILRPTSGSFELFDETPVSDHRRRIGTLLETPNFYHYLSAVQNLKITAAIKHKDPGDVERVLEIVDLTKRRHSHFSTYSLGMKQRLAIAACLLGDPEVLIFDEPTNGLDPVGIADTRELIRKLSMQGKTIIMASHLLDEVEKVCTHVAILQKGTLIAHGHVDEILISEDIIEIAAADMDMLLARCRDIHGVLNITQANRHIELVFAAGTASAESLNQTMSKQGITLNHLRLKKRTLESKFFELTKQG